MEGTCRAALTAVSCLLVFALLGCTPEAVPKPEVTDAAADVGSSDLDYVRDLLVIQAA